MLGGGLPVIRYGIDVARVPFSADPGRLPRDRRPARAAQGRRPRDRHRRARRVCRSSSSATSRRTSRTARPSTRSASGPTSTASASATSRRLPNDEVLRLMAGARAFVFPISWEEPFGLVVAEALAARDARRRDAARLAARARRARRDGFLGGDRRGARRRSSARVEGARPRRLPPRAPRSGSRRERMVSEYEAFYRKILVRMSFDFSPEALDREFPVRRNLLYLNHAAVAPLPRRVADAMTAHVAERPRPRRRRLALLVREWWRRPARRRRG